jgi:hypothetical protein
MRDKLMVIMRNLPFWMPKKNNAIWYFLLILIFILSLDFWQWNKFNPMVLGLPIWVIYFFILTILTSLIFYLFTKYFWSDSSD